MPKITSVSEDQVSLQKMRSTRFEGWRIRFEDCSCGVVKLTPSTSKVFADYASVDFSVSQKYRGRHIGRYALKKAIEKSKYQKFVAHLRKSNVASKTALCSIGFQHDFRVLTRQTIMIFCK